jgi:hypothetical protein
LDNYILKMKHELLGWEGMRIRVLLHEALAAKGIQHSALPTTKIKEGETSTEEDDRVTEKLAHDVDVERSTPMAVGIS